MFHYCSTRIATWSCAVLATRSTVVPIHLPLWESHYDMQYCFFRRTSSPHGWLQLCPLKFKWLICFQLLPLTCDFWTVTSSLTFDDWVSWPLHTLTRKWNWASEHIEHCVWFECTYASYKLTWQFRTWTIQRFDLGLEEFQSKKVSQCKSSIQSNLNVFSIFLWP